MVDKYLKILLSKTKKAERKDEVPVAALIVNENGRVIATAYNNRKKTNYVINHAECICINKTNKRLKKKVLNDCALYVTLEPCDMCKMVIKEARLRNVYYLLSRNPEKRIYSKTNFEVIHNYQKEKEIYQQILSNFFKKRR